MSRCHHSLPTLSRDAALRHGRGQLSRGVTQLQTGTQQRQGVKGSWEGSSLEHFETASSSAD